MHRDLLAWRAPTPAAQPVLAPAMPAKGEQLEMFPGFDGKPTHGGKDDDVP